jgi:hypothetical protein
MGGDHHLPKSSMLRIVNEKQNQLTHLTTQGYAQDHQDIELLRLRNFTMGRRLSDDEVVGRGGLDRIADLISSIVPFVSATFV